MKYYFFDTEKNCFIGEKTSLKQIKRGDWIRLPKKWLDTTTGDLKTSNFKVLYLVDQKLTKDIILVKLSDYNGIKQEVSRVAHQRKPKGDK